MAALLANPGVTPALLAQGTDQNIRNYFGLVWDNTNHYWNYAPDLYNAPLASGPLPGTIALLQNISGREPNFIELLKAAIAAGSLGKSIGGSEVGKTYDAWVDYEVVSQMVLRDTSINCHVIQLAANIIEQADTDGYPKRINYDDGTGPRLFAGVDDLPYFYRWKNVPVLARPSIPAPSSTVQQSLSYSGIGFELICPELWNPHDPNTRHGVIRPGSSGASELRVTVEGPPYIPTAVSVISGTSTDTPTQVQTNDGSAGSGGGPWTTPAMPLTPSSSALVFSDSNGALFREPTSLRCPGIPLGSNLAVSNSAVSGTHQLLVERPLLLDSGDNQIIAPDGSVTDYREANPAHSYIGFLMGYFPLVKVTGSANKFVYNGIMSSSNVVEYTWNDAYYNKGELMFRMQCKDAFGSWIDYDVKNWDISVSTNYRFKYVLLSSTDDILGSENTAGHGYSFDPRTSRFGIYTAYGGQGTNPPNLDPSGAATLIGNWEALQNNMLGTTLWAYNHSNPDTGAGGDGSAFPPVINLPPLPTSGFARGMGRTSGDNTNGAMRAAAVFCQNNLNALYYVASGNWRAGYYQDADGTVRRAMGAYTPLQSSTSSPTAPSETGTNVGIPTITATGTAGFWTIPIAQSQSRPMILHRPFRSVAELGYVFRDIPWKNLDFFTQESGDGGLLDIFCIHDSSNAAGLMAGKVNLNSRQAPVIQAILSGAIKDELMKSGSNSLSLTDPIVMMSGTEPQNIAKALVARTGTSPVTNVSDLVGAWVSGTGTGTNVVGREWSGRGLPGVFK